MDASGKKAAAGAPGGGGFESYAKITLGAVGSIVDQTWTKFPFGSVHYDNLNEVDTVTNKRWTATETGVYRIAAAATFLALPNTVDGVVCTIKIYKNGTGINERGTNGVVQPSPKTGMDNGTPTVIVTSLELTAGDYIEIFGWHNRGSLVQNSGGTNYCTIERIA